MEENNIVNKNFISRSKKYWDTTDLYQAMFERIYIDSVNDKKTMDEKIENWNKSAEISANQVLDKVPYKSSWKALEIGCGIGRVIKPLRSKLSCVDGVDIAENMISFAKEYLNECSDKGQVWVNNGYDIAFLPNCSYDLVYSVIVFQHIRSASVVNNYLKEIMRVLKPGGYFKLQVFDNTKPQRGKFDEEALDGVDYGLMGNGYSPEEFKMMLGSQDFEILNISHSSPWIWGTCKKPETAVEQNGYLVSAIVSTYNSEKHIRYCLDDLLNQTLYQKNQLEIVIVNAASQQNEVSIIREYQEKFKHIKLIEAGSRVSLYKAWNMAIGASSAIYITNANTDDGHRRDALELLAAELQKDQSIDLVYAHSKMTILPNQSFEDCDSDDLLINPEFTPAETLLHYQFGPQPMWRKAVHRKIGYFNADFFAVGDYDFNIRFALKCKAKLIPEVLGVFYKNPDSITSSFTRQGDEKKALLQAYRVETIILELYKNSGWLINTNEEKRAVFIDQANKALEYYRAGIARKGCDVQYAVLCSELSAGYGEKIYFGKSKKIAFIAQNNNVNFLKDVFRYFQNRYIVKLVNSTSNDAISCAYNWADILWLEWADIVAINISKLPKRNRIICRLHAYEAFLPYLKDMNWQNIDTLVFLCGNVRDYVEKKLPEVKTLTKTVQISGGLDLKKFLFVNRGHGFNIAFVASLTQTKNLSLLLQIINFLVKNVNKSYHLHVFGEYERDAGAISAEIPKAYMEHIIKEMDLQNNVTFYGFVQNDQFNRIMEQMNYIISTSYREGLTYNISEAMAMGIMPIIHNWPGAKKNYPEKYIFTDIAEVENFFMQEYDSLEYRRYVEENHDLEKALTCMEKHVLGSEQSEYGYGVKTGLLPKEQDNYGEMYKAGSVAYLVFWDDITSSGIIKNQLIPTLEYIAAKQTFRLLLISVIHPNFNYDQQQLQVINKRLQDSNIKLLVIRGDADPYNPQAVLLLIEELVKNEKIGLFHCRSYFASLIAAKIREKLEIPYIFDIRGLFPEEQKLVRDEKSGRVLDGKTDEKYQKDKNLERYLLETADASVVLNPAFENALRKNLTGSIKRVITIPSFVDTDLFKFRMEVRKQVRMELGLADSLVFIFSGSISPWYDFDWMIRFFKSIHAKIKNSHLLILAYRDKAFSNGNSSSFVEKLLLEHGVDQKSFSLFSAEYHEIPLWLSAADFGLICFKEYYKQNLYFSQPIKLAEYLAAGLPVIMNQRIVEHSEIVSQNQLSGWILQDEGDVNKFIEYLNGSLPSVKDYERFRQNNAVFAERYSKEKSCDAYQNLYLELKDNLNKTEHSGTYDKNSLEKLLAQKPDDTEAMLLLSNWALENNDTETFLNIYSKLLQYEKQDDPRFEAFEKFLKTIIPQKITFKESRNAHKWLDGLKGVEIGSAAHNAFGLNTRNVGLRRWYNYSALKKFGQVAKIDIEAEMSNIPLEDESEDFIISSHVIEHAANLIKTLLEWYRIVKPGGYIYMITPKRDSAESDIARPLSDWDKIYNDFITEKIAEQDAHFNVFTIEAMKEFIGNIFGRRLKLVDALESDDKVGNGFTVVYRKTASLQSAFPWIIKNGDAEHDLLSAPELMPKGFHKEQPGKSPLDNSHRIKVAVLPNDLKKDGCSHYRILSPLGALADKVEVLWVEDFINKGHKYAKEYAEKADLIVIQRFFPNPDTQKFVDYLFSLNKPVVYELDDLLTEVPATNPSHGWSNIRKPFMLETAKRASAVTVTTPRLKNYFSNINQNTVVLPNLLNGTIWQNTVPHHEAVVVIAYAGTRTHAADLRIIEQALFMVSEKYKGRVGFIFMGCKTEALERLTNFNFIPPETDYNAYAQLLQTLPIDLMLVPLAESEFNNCKSNIKWLEYSACEIPCIFSDLEPYNSCVKDHQTGLLVKNDTLSWMEAICEMVDNAGLRKQIARAARIEVLEKYTVNSGAHLWYEFYMLLILSNKEKFTSITSRKEMVTVVSFSLTQDIPSSQYLRQIAPLALLEKSHQVKLVNGWNFVTKKDGKPFFDYTKLPSDAIVFLQRDFTSLEFVLEAPLKFIYEIDDNLMELPANHPDYQAYLSLANLLKRCLSKFDLITTSTENLKQELLKYNHNVTVIPNYLPLVPANSFKEKSSTLTILISGTKSHLIDLTFLIPVMKNIALKYGDSLRFIFWGFFPEELQGLANVSHMEFFVKDYRDYLNALSSLNPDIGLIPLLDTQFNRYKSDIKWKEYCSCKMAVLASDVLPYQSIENGVNGILLPNRAEIWQQQLEELIVNREKCKMLAENGYQTVIQKELLGINLVKWDKVIDFVLQDNELLEVKHDLPLVSIIIPLYNKVELTGQCLEAVLQNTKYPNYEIILVDNASSDGTEAFLNSFVNSNKNVNIIRNTTNLGFAKACNIGARAAGGKYLLFLNNDTIPQQNWLDELVGTMENCSNVGIAGSKLFYGNQTIQHAGASMRFDKKFFRHQYKYLDRNHPLVCRERELDAVTAACFITFKSLFVELGGFDEQYLNGCEDMDYCMAVRKKGLKIIYNPKSELYHLESQTPRATNCDAANFQHYLQKWGADAMQNEIEVYNADGFWQKADNGQFKHNYNAQIVEWTNEIKQLQSSNRLNDGRLLEEVIARIYPVKEWQRSGDFQMATEKHSEETESFQKRVLGTLKDVIKKLPDGESVETLPATVPERKNTNKILFVCHDFPPYKYAGAQLYAYYLALALTKNSCQVDVFYPVAQSARKDEAEKELYSVSCKEFNGLRVYEITIPDQNENLYQAFYNPQIEQAFRELLLREKYQIVHYHLLHRLSATLPLISQELKIKSVATLHDYWLLCIRGHMIDNNFLECSGPATYEKCCKCQFGEIKPEFLEYFQTRIKLTKAGYAAIDHKISPSGFLADVHSDYGFVKPQILPLGWLTYPEQKRIVNPAKVVFGYLGQVVSRKGLDILLQAVRIIELNNWQLKIYGEIYEPWYYEKIKPIIENHPNISYHGGYDNSAMSQIFDEIDVFIMPSRRENYPLTLIEALSAKIPAVASDVGGVREMMTDGKEGFIFKNGDVMQLKSILENILSQPQLIAQMKNSIGSLKTIEDNSNEMYNIYHNLIKQKKVVFACIRELHLPVLLPICEQLKNIRPDLQIGFMAPNYRESKDGIPQEGLSIASLELLKSKNIEFWDWNNNHEKFDCVVCADVCYWYVDGWGPIVNVGHGTISKGVYFTSDKIARRENFADILCVPGEWYKNCYGEQVITNIEVTGFAKMDELAKTDIESIKREKFARAGFTADKTTILYAPTFNLELTSMIILAEAWQKMPQQYQVYVKLHGACEEDLKNYYRKLCKLLPKLLYYVEDADIADYMLVSDLMISDVSSVALEYLVLNKPIILVDNPDMSKYSKYNPANVEFLFRDCAYCVKNENEMFAALAKLQTSDSLLDQRALAKKRLFGELDGKNSLRIVNQIQNLLNSTPKLNGLIQRFSVYVPGDAQILSVKENLLRAKVAPVVYVDRYQIELKQWEQIVVVENQLPGNGLLVLTGGHILPFEWDNMLSLVLVWLSDYDLLAPLFDRNCTNDQQKFANYRASSHDITQMPYSQLYQGFTKFQEDFYEAVIVDELLLDGLVINLKSGNLSINLISGLLNNRSLKKGVLTGFYAYSI